MVTPASPRAVRRCHEGGSCGRTDRPLRRTAPAAGERRQAAVGPGAIRRRSPPARHAPRRGAAGATSHTASLTGFEGPATGATFLGPDDFDHLKPLPVLWHLGDQWQLETPVVDRHVRYVGQPLGLAVASSRAEAEDVLEQILVEIDELPRRRRCGRGARPGRSAALPGAGHESTVARSRRATTRRAPSRCSPTADHVLRTTIATPRLLRLTDGDPRHRRRPHGGPAHRVVVEPRAPRHQGRDLRRASGCRSPR